MPNLDPWVNQNEEHMVATNTINKFENHLLSIKAEHQKRIRPNLHPTYNERYEKWSFISINFWLVIHFVICIGVTSTY